MWRDRVHLLDIVDSAELITSYVESVTQTAFDTDVMRQGALIRELQVIGEATKRLSDSFRMANPQVDWRRMAGMRDVLIHSYDRVDLGEVWRVATHEIPQLLAQLTSLLHSWEQEGDATD